MNTNLIPFISIVIPTFNRAEYISKALNSVIDQTFKDWELIIVDNNSTDHTDKIINQYTDPRIRYLKIKNDGVIAKSRNLGIEVSKGEWIAFLDSDDWWTEDKLEICLKNIDQEVDFIYHNISFVVEKSKSYFKTKKNVGRQLKKPVLKDLLIGVIDHGNPIVNSSVIVRKKLLTRIGGISENKKLVASEDFHTWLRIAQVTDRFKYLKEKLGYYLMHNNSAQNRDLSIPHREAIQNFKNFFNKKQKLDFEVKMRYMSSTYNIAISNYKKAKEDLIYVINNGNINFRIRSFIKIILIIFR